MSAASTEKFAWHVVRTKARQEFRALENLQNQGYDCFLPTVDVEKPCGGKPQIHTEALFSRYLFIRLDSVTSNWAAIRSTRGVSEMVKFGDRAAVLPEAWVDAMRRVPRVRVRQGFATGERVAVAAGPFAGLEGIFQAPDGDARALILLEMMHQPQKLSFAMELLRKAA